MRRIFSESSFCNTGSHIATGIWSCHKPISQWQCSFHLKAALPLVKRLVTVSNHNITGPMGWVFVQVVFHFGKWQPHTYDKLWAFFLLMSYISHQICTCFCCAQACHGQFMVDLHGVYTHILQGYFTGTYHCPDAGEVTLMDMGKISCLKKQYTNQVHNHHATYH